MQRAEVHGFRNPDVYVTVVLEGCVWLCSRGGFSHEAYETEFLGPLRDLGPFHGPKQGHSNVNT